MTTEQLVSTIETVLYAAAIFFTVCMIIRFILMEYRLYKRDQAEIATAQAIAYYKHPEMESVLAGQAVLEI